jgi:hypothetical protein
MKNKYEKYTARREINPAFILNQIGKSALRRIEAKEKYRNLDIITIQLMCAFTMESVLNHIGKVVFRSKDKDGILWKLIERNEPRDKLDAIAEIIQIKIDYSILPFSDFSAFFSFRNEFAHGKTNLLFCEDIKENQIDDDNWLIMDKIPELQTKWEKTLSIANAKRWRESVYKISEILANYAKCYDPVRFGDFIDTSGQLKL